MSDEQTVSSPNMPAWSDLLSRPEAERKTVRIHLVGIGGSGLSAIAELLLQMGFSVSGSDQRPNDATDELARHGATIFRGHQGKHIAGADLVLISSAVPDDNPEVAAARAAGIPVVKRFDFLGPLLEGQHGIGVAGSHGKTTTTSLIAIILLRAGLDPSFIVGARVPVGPAEGMMSATAAARAGKGPFVIEADEYDRMFLGLRLEIAVVTNVDWDHVDCYPTPVAFNEAFRAFAGQLPEWGLLLVCSDDAGAMAVRDAVKPGVTVRTFGLSRKPTGRRAIWHRTPKAASMQRSGSRGRRWHPVAVDPGPAQRAQRAGRHRGGALARHPAGQGSEDAVRLHRRRTALRVGRRGGRCDGHRRLRSPPDRSGDDTGGGAHALPQPAHLGSVSTAHVQPHEGATERLRAQFR